MRALIEHRKFYPGFVALGREFNAGVRPGEPGLRSPYLARELLGSEHIEEESR